MCFREFIDTLQQPNIELWKHNKKNQGGTTAMISLISLNKMNRLLGGGVVYYKSIYMKTVNNKSHVINK